MNHNMNNISILLPTQNRPYQLKRALKFYKNELLSGVIHVIDSSDTENKIRVKKIIKDSSLKIVFYDYEYGTPPHKKLGETLSNLDAEFFLMMADDDFIFPAAILKCVQFLSLNTDYSAAHGRSYTFSVSKRKKVNIFRYLQHHIDMPDPTVRFKHHMSDWSTTAYSVQRTENVKAIFAILKRFEGDIRSQELIWYAINVIRGKIAKLDTIYMLRQSSLPKEWEVDSFYSWIKEQKHTQELICELSEELSRVSGLSAKSLESECHKYLKKWIRDHKQFSYKNIFNYSITYYKNKFTKKILVNRWHPHDATDIYKVLTICKDD